MPSPFENDVLASTQRTLGARNVFKPDCYAKGSGRREPADIVWSTPECIVLIYCKEIFSSKKRLSPSDNTRKQKSNDNLRQAKGWLDEWRHGRRLTGANAYRTFDIAYSSKQAVIVLSLVDYAGYDGEYHHEFETEMGVDFCATLPAPAFNHFTRIGCGIFDLLGILDLLREIGDKFHATGSTTVGLVMAYDKWARMTVDPTGQLLHHDPNRIINTLHVNRTRRFMQAYKHALMPPKNPSELCEYSLWDDLTLADQYQIALAVSYAIEYRKDRDLTALMTYEKLLSGHGFSVEVGFLADLVRHPEMHRYPIEWSDWRTSPGVLHILYGLDFDQIMLWSESRGEAPHNLSRALKHLLDK